MQNAWNSERGFFDMCALRAFLENTMFQCFLENTISHLVHFRDVPRTHFFENNPKIIYANSRTFRLFCTLQRSQITFTSDEDEEGSAFTSDEEASPCNSEGAAGAAGARDVGSLLILAAISRHIAVRSKTRTTHTTTTTV